MRKRYLAGGGELAGDGERVWPELRRGGSGGKVADKEKPLPAQDEGRKQQKKHGTPLDGGGREKKL